MRLQGFLERQSEDMRLEEMAIQIGNISGSGEIVLEHDGERPTIGGRINFGKIFLGDVPIYSEPLAGSQKPRRGRAQMCA